MAATRLITLHINKGMTALASLQVRIDYAQNPDKTEKGNIFHRMDAMPRQPPRNLSCSGRVFCKAAAGISSPT